MGIKSFKRFIREYRGKEILKECNKLNCSLRDVIEQLKAAYASYVKEHKA